MNGFALKILDREGAEIGTLNVEELESDLLEKAANATGLNLKDFFWFIILRQLEAFFPKGGEGRYRICVEAVEEITSCLSLAEDNSSVLRAACSLLVERVNTMERPASTADQREAVSNVRGLSLVVQHLARGLYVDVSDANGHWTTAARPALIESRPCPDASAPVP